MITFSKLGKYGRLGNQLWQVASTMGIAEKHDRGCLFPSWNYGKYFKYQIPQTNEINSVINKTHLEKQESYYDVKLDRKYNWDLEGYFQSWKYFKDIEDKIRYYFEYGGQFEKKKDFVSVHVRRGDYLTYSHVFVELKMNYYNAAMNYFGNDKTFMIFSDDITWCKRRFKHRNIVFDSASPEILSFMEMAMCEHHIIANSSFSWWAAWLDPNPDKVVIAPNKWVHTAGDKIDDRLPEDWIRMDV